MYIVSMISVNDFVFFLHRKNVPDFSASREKNDLGFITFDLQSDILSIIKCHPQFMNLMTTVSAFLLYSQIKIPGSNIQWFEH